MKYDSKFEKLVHETFNELEFHPENRIPYITKHVYEPDFIFTKDNKTFYVETKGRFRDRKEAAKYVAVKESLLESEEVVFILMKKGVAMPNAQKRKNGTKQTMEEYLDKNGLRYFYVDNFNSEDL